VLLDDLEDLSLPGGEDHICHRASSAIQVFGRIPIGAL
jgi:hypothetical protein